MKILHIVDMMVGGGAEKVMWSTVEALPTHQHYVLVLSSVQGYSLPNLPNVEVIELSENLDRGLDDLAFYYVRRFMKVKLRNMPVRMLMRIQLFLRPQVQKLVKAKGIDVVHAHHFWSQILIRGLRTTAGRVETIHSIRFSQTETFLNRIDRDSATDSCLTFFVSNAVRESWKKVIGRDPVGVTMPNFVDEAFFNVTRKRRYIAGNEIKMVVVGRLSPEKNHAFLLRQLHKLSVPYSVDIYGSGPLENGLKKIAQELGVRVTFKGYIDAVLMSSVLPDYDLFVLPSLSEGNPLSAIEAIASGTPVALSSIPSNVEVAGENGHYFSLDENSNFSELIGKIFIGEIDVETSAVSVKAHLPPTAHRAAYMAKLVANYHNLVNRVPWPRESNYPSS